MIDEAWRRFVSDFCLAHGLLTAGRVARLRTNEFYFLANRQFLLGAGRRMVTRLLERAAAETERDDDP